MNWVVVTITQIFFFFFCQDHILIANHKSHSHKNTIVDRITYFSCKSYILLYHNYLLITNYLINRSQSLQFSPSPSHHNRHYLDSHRYHQVFASNPPLHPIKVDNGSVKTTTEPPPNHQFFGHALTVP